MRLDHLLSKDILLDLAKCSGWFVLLADANVICRLLGGFFCLVRAAPLLRVCVDFAYVWIVCVQIMGAGEVFMSQKCFTLCPNGCFSCVNAAETDDLPR